MFIPLGDLLVPLTKEQIETKMLDAAKALGFPVSNWGVGGVARTLIKLFTTPLADAYALIPQLAAGRYIDTASGQWLTNLGLSRFGEEQLPATFTYGYFRFTAAPGIGAGLTPGSHQVRLVSAQDLKFITAESKTIPTGGFVDCLMVAEHPGTVYNIPTSSTLAFVTPIAGVTVTNPVYAGGTWITVPGQDLEDEATFRARCKAKWGTLAVGGPTQSYVAWALAASPLVRRVTVGAADGMAHFNVYVAGSDATSLPGATITAISDYIAARKPIGALPTVVQAPTQSQAFDVTVTVKPACTLTAAAISTAISKWVNALPVGGEVIAGFASGIFRDRLASAVRALDPLNIVLCKVTTPAADVAVTAGSIVSASTINVTIAFT